MDFRKFSALILFLSICCQFSCVSTKASADKISEDSQHRLTIENPYFAKKLTPVGIAVTGLATSAAAYLGYLSNLFSNPTSDGTEDSDIISGVYGAFLGFGLSSAGNILQGHTDREKLEGRLDQGEWLDLFGEQYVVMDNYYGNKLVVIDKKYESDFQFKTAKDVADFDSAFPDSEYLDDNLNSSLPYFKRSSLLNLIDLMHYDLRDFHQVLVWDQLFEKSNSLQMLEESRLLANTYVMRGYEEKAQVLAYQRAIDLDADELLLELKGLYQNFPNCSWIPKILSQLESKLDHDEFYRISEVFEGTYTIRKGVVNGFYFYVPPLHQGIVILNDIPH